MPDHTISTCFSKGGLPRPFSDGNWAGANGTTLLFCGRKLSLSEQANFIRVIRSWPRPLLRRLSSDGFIQIIVLSSTEFAEKFPESRRQDETAVWERGRLFIEQTRQLKKGMPAIEVILRPVRRSIEKKLAAERSSPPRSSQLIPRDTRSLTGVVKYFMAHGFQVPLGPLLSADLGVAETAGELGQSTHQLRLRLTNPRFNRWVYNFFVNPIFAFDPSVSFYLGFYATTSTRPFGVIGTASWGVDSRLTVLSNLELYLDTNLQYRLHSSGNESSDEFAIEITPRLSTHDKRFSFGLSLATVLSPERAVRASLEGRFLF